MTKRIIVGLTIFIACWGRSLCARDAFVMLSGGGSPLENNYSQYLQAKAMVAFFERNYPPDSVWVFFGAGNREGEKPVFGDVLREKQRDGLTISSWLPGSLRHNRPARRDIILRTLREEILPAVSHGGTLFLFVGDHGSRTRGRNGESIISLWGLARDPKNEHGWRNDENETLGVAELGRVLAQGIGKGRVVFCMTQCHAGGFHYLAVPHQMTPNPKWFTSIPEWAVTKEQPVRVRAAGFAATDEFSPAAGCDPDPDPGEWAGYERFLPEQLLGVDLFTLHATGKPLRSFAEAHVAATLVDCTIDKPYSTSDQYLERWATLIETRLAKDTNLTQRVKEQLATYRRTVDGAQPKLSDRAFRERQTICERFLGKLIEQNPAARELLLHGSRKHLEDAIGPARGRGRNRIQRPPQESTQSPAPGPSDGRSVRGGGRRGRSEFAEARQLWKETIRPAWQTALAANQVGGFPIAARDFEQFLLREDAQGREYLFGDEDLVDEEIFWHSGYSNPQTLDLVRAEAIARWGAERRNKILAWAAKAPDEQVRTATEKLCQLMARRWQTQPASQPPGPADKTAKQTIPKKVAAERVLFSRRILAAWEFLLAMNERPALARLRELTELERTPLPRPWKATEKPTRGELR